MNPNPAPQTPERVSRAQPAIAFLTVLTFLIASLASIGPSPALADEETPATESPTSFSSPTPTEEPTLEPIEVTEETGESESPPPTPTEEALDGSDSSETDGVSEEESTALAVSDEPKPTATGAPAETPNPETVEPTTEAPMVTPTEPEESTGASAGDTDPTATPTPEPVPYLSYFPASRPDCQPAIDQPAIVAAGASLDYRCTYEVELTGTNLSPTAVHLDWTVLVSIADGWSIQFLPPITEPAESPDWTDESHNLGGFQHQSRIADPSPADTVTPFTTTERLTFGLRLHRSACTTGRPSLELDVSVWASLPDLDTSKIETTDHDPEPYKVIPELAPIPEPSLTFSGSLDFGDVPVDANGVRETPAPQTITVTVSGLDQSCGTWTLGLKARKLGGEDGSVISAASLNLVSINDDTRPDGGCPLNQGCNVAVVEAGPDAPPTLTFTLGVSLVLPDQLSATTFNSTLTASLTEAGP